jgi:hypothetical protein
MLIDLVVDTNVWVHQNNPDHEFSVASHEFCLAILESTASICVDEGFSLDSAHNTSIIGHEYIEHVRRVFLAYDILVKLLSDGRVRFVSNQVDEATRRVVNTHIGNSHDRVFVRVAFNSEEHILVSHDFDDFPTAVRREIDRRVGVRIETAERCKEELRD